MKAKRSLNLSSSSLLPQPSVSVYSYVTSSKREKDKNYLTINSRIILNSSIPRKKKPVIGAKFIAGQRACVVVGSLARSEHCMMEGADVDFGMITVLGILIHFVPVTKFIVNSVLREEKEWKPHSQIDLPINGVLDILPNFGFLTMVVRL